MKKILIMAVAAMMATLNANAQSDELKNEIGVFYGVGSASDVISSIGAAFTVSTGDQTGFWGPIGVEYYHHLTPGVALGAVAEYAGCKWDKNYGSDNSVKSTYITVMPSVKFNWMRRDHFGLYSSLSAGVMIASLNFDDVRDVTNAENESETTFMFQVTGIGAEFGGALRGFVEIGFGEKGLACAGLRYRF